MPTIKIRNRIVGAGYPCYVIAEMSANHGGSYDKALAIVHAAKKAGADAIKLQTYTPDTMTIDCANEYFQIKHPLWNDKTLYQLYKEAQTPWEWHKPLQQEAEKIGFDFFSTPFDETAVDFLEQLDVAVYKVASFELTDEPLLIRIGKTRKPVILSTGMATLTEIARAVSVLYASGAADVALLKCTSAYPAKPEDMNLRALGEIRRLFRCPVGLSDHTLDDTASLVAVGLGMDILEKHLKLNDSLTTPDAAFSMLPQQFGTMVRHIRQAEASLGHAALGRSEGERENLRFRRSIFVTQDVEAGEVLGENNLKVVRPGMGLPPKCWQKVLGGKAAKTLKRGMPLTYADVLDTPKVEGAFTFRSVNQDDIDWLFKLRNDPDVRKGSIVEKCVSWEEHQKWFVSKLADSKVVFWAVEYGGTPAGQVRFDLDGEGAVTSISLLPSLRGRGVSAKILQQACSCIFKQKPASFIRAIIRRENVVSLKAFLKAGFLVDETHLERGVEVFQCRLNRDL